MWFDRWSRSIRFSFRSNFRSICAIFWLGITLNSVFREMVSWVRKGFLLPKWVKIFSRPFYMVLVFTKSNRKLSFEKNSFFLVDSAIFDRIDDRDLIGIFVKDLIYNRIGKFIFWKIGIGAKVKKLDRVQPWLRKTPYKRQWKFNLSFAALRTTRF